MKTSEEIIKEFKADLAELLAKYDAELSIREKTHGYDRFVVGIEVDIGAVYDADHNMISEYVEFNIGTWANKDNVCTL